MKHHKPTGMRRMRLDPEQSDLLRRRTDPHVEDFVRFGWSIQKLAWVCYMQGMIDCNQVHEGRPKPRLYLVGAPKETQP